MNSVYVTIEAPNMTYGRFYDDLDRFRAYAMRKREEGYGLTNARILERYGGLCLILVMSKEAIASTSSWQGLMLSLVHEGQSVFVRRIRDRTEIYNLPKKATA